MKTLLSFLLLAGLFALPIAGCRQNAIRGSGGRELKLVVPDPVTIQRGQTKVIQVQLQRDNMTDPVHVWITDLPDGVTAQEPSRTVQTDAATFVLKATDTAALVTNHAATVTVTARDGMGGAKTFRINVVRQ